MSALRPAAAIVLLLALAAAPALGTIVGQAPVAATAGSQASGNEDPNAPPTDNAVTIADPADDVILKVASRAGGPSENTSALNGQYDHIDILRVLVGDEADASFQVSLFLKSITQSNPVGFASRAVYFSYGKVDWRVSANPCQRQAQAQQAQGCLSYLDAGRGQYRAYKSVPLEVKVGDKSLVWTIDKKLVFNEDRVPARYEAKLEKLFAATAHSYLTTGFLPTGDPTGGVVAVDRAPNDGFGGVFTFALGANGHGHVGLVSDQPIRVSNGEATTLVYKVLLFNYGGEKVSVSLETKGLPNDWTVRVPGLLEVPAHTNILFPVILSLPFTHLHGETVTFQVHAQAVGDASSYADVDLGVFWTEIPQPAGHHDISWFHSAPADGIPPPGDTAFPFMQTWFNPLQDDPDPDATDANVPAFFNDAFFRTFGNPTGNVPPQWSASWLFPLAPQLQIGLDFDLSRPAVMSFDVVPKVPATQGKAVVQLLYCDPAKAGGANNATSGFGFCPAAATVEIGQGQSSAVALNPGTPVHFDVPIPIKPEFDLVAFRQGANVAVNVVLQSDVPENLFGTEPRPEFVTDKAQIQLPLIEYHDPIDQAFEKVGDLSLTAQSPFEKKVNPGKTTVFGFLVTNKADAAQSVQLEIQGENREWARMVGDDKVQLAPGESRNVTLAVEAPVDAQDGMRAELFLVAQSLDDPSVVAAVRLRAAVVSGEDIPDESGMAVQKEAKGGSPGFEALAVLAAVGALAAAIRRRGPA